MIKIVCRPNSKMKKRFKDKWFNYYGPHCAYCTKEVGTDYTIDHIIPRSKGGRNTMVNMVIACRICNELKADKLPTQYDQLMLTPLKYEDTIGDTNEHN